VPAAGRVPPVPGAVRLGAGVPALPPVLGHRLVGALGPLGRHPSRHLASRLFGQSTPAAN